MIATTEAAGRRIAVITSISSRGSCRMRFPASAAYLRRTKNNERFLIREGYRRRGADGASFPLGVLEKAILAKLAELDPREILDRDDGPDEVAELTAQLTRFDARIQALADSLDDDAEAVPEIVAKMKARTRSARRSARRSTRRIKKRLRRSRRRGVTLSGFSKSSTRRRTLATCG